LKLELVLRLSNTHDNEYTFSLFDEHGDDAGGHEIGHGAGEHGA
jgi:hypothetical protein